MNDPRWTEHASGALRWKRDEDDDEIGFYLVQSDQVTEMDVLVPTPALNALVAAVRDADLLRQARHMAENVSQHRDTILGTYGAAQTFFTLGDLLDLLASPSGTPTGTHPQEADDAPAQ